MSAPWMDRLPTPEEVEAHAKAHGVDGTSRGLWMARLSGDDVPRVGWLEARDHVRLWSTAREEWVDLDANDRVCPLTARGLPVALVTEVERAHARVEEAERERDAVIEDRRLAQAQRWEDQQAFDVTMARISEALSPRMSWGVTYSRDEVIARIDDMHAAGERLRLELDAERAVSASLRAVVDVGAIMRDEYGAGRDDALARRPPASPSPLYRLGYAGGMAEREAKGDL